MHTTDDPLLPLRRGEALAELVPHASIRTVPGVGHAPGLPTRLAEVVLTHVG